MPIAQRRPDIADTRSGIDGDQVDPWLITLPVDAEQQRALASMLHQVRRGLGHRQGELVGPHGREVKPIRHRQPRAPARCYRAGILDPDPPHVLTGRSPHRPAQRDHFTTTMLVPAPGSEVSSNSSTSRRAPDKPSPRPLPVVQPSVRARLISAMPGPASVNPTFTPALPLPDLTTSTLAVPPPPWIR